MRRGTLVAVGCLALVASTVTVRAADQRPKPDSKTQPIADGCNRTQLGLLGEAAATMDGGAHPTPFASWVYVDGDNTPKTLEGTSLGTHTAGTDLFGVHDTYDTNFDIAPDPAYEHLLSSRNALQDPPQIHTEWESGLAPLFAWPSPGDHVRETGSEIWDCGHWQGDKRAFANSDFLPGDPLAAVGAEQVGGEEIEIHPVFELATWRARGGSFVPLGQAAPVHASRLDVAISNQGGKAKGVEECALLAPGHPEAFAERLPSGCSTLQDVTGRDYTYVLKPPGPRPSATSRLVLQQDVRYAHHGPAMSNYVATFTGDESEARIVVPFTSVAPSAGLQDFGATWHAWWSDDPTPVRHFRVTLQSVTINSNLDGDSGDTNGNPSVTPDGEWNMYADVGGQWVNLHDPRAGHVDLMPVLGAVPSAKKGPLVLPVPGGPKLAPTDLFLTNTDAVHVFVDARECDQPGYVDCPTKNELATTGKSAGRAELSLPVSQLAGKGTTVTIHPPVCPAGASCPEDKNPVGLCPHGCYAITYLIEDADVIPFLRPAMTVSGDGTASGTVIGATGASTMPWWIGPVTRYSEAQSEENRVVADVIARMLGG